MLNTRVPQSPTTYAYFGKSCILGRETKKAVLEPTLQHSFEFSVVFKTFQKLNFGLVLSLKGPIEIIEPLSSTQSSVGCVGGRKKREKKKSFAV